MLIRSNPIQDPNPENWQGLIVDCGTVVGGAGIDLQDRGTATGQLLVNVLVQGNKVLTGLSYQCRIFWQMSTYRKDPG